MKKGKQRSASYRPNLSAPLPSLASIEAIQAKLESIFPKAFPDRGDLVSQMAARVIFVFLYGGFIGAIGRYLRPSFIYHFTAEQSKKTSRADRIAWTETAHRSGNRPAGKRWYADTSKEPIRDDLIRNRLIPIGAVGRSVGNDHSRTSSVPIYFLAQDFAALFDPDCNPNQCAAKIAAWLREHLSTSALQRMALSAHGAERNAGDLLVELPNGERVKLASGASNLIVKCLIENFAKIHLKKPAVLWISASDKKSYPQFQTVSAALGLHFDLGAELPDLILADLVNPIRFYFCEAVATDGAVTESRKLALLSLVAASTLEAESIVFLTAFEDRNAQPFRKVFSQLAKDSLVWFRTEPSTVVIISTLLRWIATDAIH